MLRRSPEELSTAVSDLSPGDVDEVRLGLGQGAGLTAMETQQVVSVEDLTVERRFGGFPARALGALSSSSTPLAVSGSTVGALTSYAGGPTASRRWFATQ